MKDIFQQICTANNIELVYGRDDFNNLYDDVDDGKVVMFLRPLQTSENFGEYGNTESIDWSGSFILCMDSNLDEIDYDTRYEKYIKPITQGAYKAFKSALVCLPTYSIQSLRTVEVINSFDINADGLAVEFLINEKQ